MLASTPMHTDLKHTHLLQNLWDKCASIKVCAHSCAHKCISTYLYLGAYIVENWLK